MIQDSMAVQDTAEAIEEVVEEAAETVMDSVAATAEAAVEVVAESMGTDMFGIGLVVVLLAVVAWGLHRIWGSRKAAK